MPEERVNWQPISALPLIGSMVECLLDEVGEQYGYLKAARTRPHLLDSPTIGRVIKLYSTEAADLWVYEEQFSRWKNLNLTSLQRQDVDRLAAQLPVIRERIAAILALAQELKGGTIETVLAKSDLELGLEFLVGNRERGKLA